MLAFNSIPSEAPPVNLGNEATGGQRVNGILWDAATTAQKDAWLVANSDRVVFGASIANGASDVMATALATIDATNDKLTAANILLAKRVARRAMPAISPYSRCETKGREYFVLFCGQNAFRDAAADPAIYNANKDARPREGRRHGRAIRSFKTVICYIAA